MVSMCENSGSSNIINEELIKQASTTHYMVHDCAHVNDFSFNNDDFVALSFPQNVHNGKIRDSKKRRKGVYFCVPVNNHHNNVEVFFREPTIPHYYVPVFTVVFNNAKKTRLLNNVNTTHISHEELVNTTQKLLIMIIALFKHYKNNNTVINALYNLHGAFHLGDTIEELIISDKGLLSTKKHLTGLAVYSLTHYFITKAYDQYLNMVNSNSTDYQNEYYDRLLITILNWSYDHEAMLNYLVNPNMFTTPDSSIIVSNITKHVNDSKISPDHFSLLLFYHCFINTDNYNTFIETFKYPLHYLKAMESENIEKQALILIEKHNKMSTITKNVSKHPIMRNRNNDMSLHNDIKNTNASIVYSWAQIVLGGDLSTHSLFPEVLNNNETIADNTLEFLFSKKILDYYMQNPGHDFGVNNLIKKDLETMGISYENTILSTTDQIYGVDFFLPYIILHANNYFNHNINKDTIKHYYNHCIHTNIYTENDDYDDGILYITNYSIFYTIVGFLHDKEKLNNFIRAYPIISNFLYTNDNPKTIPLIINHIVNKENNITNMLVNNEITMEHLVNIIV